MKKTGTIICVMLLAASVFASSPVGMNNTSCHSPALNGRCRLDTLMRVKNACTQKRTGMQAKKVFKEEPKSIFSGLFSFDFPALPLENFLLSAQKALIEKFS